MKIIILFTVMFCSCNYKARTPEPTIYQMDSIKNVQVVDELEQLDSVHYSVQKKSVQ